MRRDDERPPEVGTTQSPPAAGQFSLRVVLLAMATLGGVLAFAAPYAGELSLWQIWCCIALLTTTGVAVILGAAIPIYRRRQAEPLLGKRLLEMPVMGAWFWRWFARYFVLHQTLLFAALASVFVPLVGLAERTPMLEFPSGTYLVVASFFGYFVVPGFLLGATLGNWRRVVSGLPIVFGEHGVLSSGPTFYPWKELRHGTPGKRGELTLQVANRRRKIHIPDEYRPQAEVILAEKLTRDDN